MLLLNENRIKSWITFNQLDPTHAIDILLWAPKFTKDVSSYCLRLGTLG